MEVLLINIILILIHLKTYNDYCDLLDMMFLSQPDSIVLLELEELFSNTNEIYKYLMRYFNYKRSMDKELFKKELFKELNLIFINHSYQYIGDKTYLIWKLLPEEIQYDDDIFILNYFGESIDYSSDEDLEKLYKKMMRLNYEKSNREV